uniref:Centromere protein H C-terminal domain-containing protein n=3 Tax=Pyxicephalus adspersus TaxID=30357 RepID=A0AAV3AAK3_PYXAD|nr:TPA: hypothetical protein GDO54_014426 [Pyxicephalus adspersus]
MQIFYSIQNKILEKNADSELLKKNINHSMDIASLILREQKESRAMEKRLSEIKEKRMVLKENSTALMSELQSIVDELRLQNEPKEQKLKKIYGYVQKEMDATFILQNIFQRLVHASQVNWVEDPKLRDAVIKAGKNLLCF